MQYPYTQKNLFLEPEFYEYSRFDRDEIFDTWKHQRLEFVGHLQTAIPDATVDIPPPLEVGGNFELSRILQDIWNENLDEDVFQTELGVLASLVTKFEIFRRLFKTYDASLRKAPAAEVATPSDYVLFAKILARECAASDLCYLVSTLLKLTDALTSLPPETFSQENQADLRDILHDEQELILYWRGKATKSAST